MRLLFQQRLFSWFDSYDIYDEEGRTVIPPSHTCLSEPDGTALLQRLERTGRICYKSEGKITETSYAPFLRSRRRK